MPAGRSGSIFSARSGRSRRGRAVSVSGRSAARALEISERLYTRIVNHLADAAPYEGCGLIAFDGGRPVEVYPGTNILRSATRFRMADSEVVRAVQEMDRRGWWLGAIYHSHPNSPPEPSTTDLKEANWPDALMIIVSFMTGEPQMRAWRVKGLGFEPVEVVVVPAPRRARWLDQVQRRARALVDGRGEQQPAAAGHNWAETPPARPRPAIASGSQGAPRPQPPPAPLPHGAHRRAVVGILGGMGPLATADLYRKIILATDATTDQEHLPVVIWADPRVPDRTEALLSGGADPVPWLVRGAQALAQLGADFIVMPCNTAHAFLEQVQPRVDKPFLSMIDAAVDAVARGLPDVRIVGLLATSGALASGIYQRALHARGLRAVIPDDDHQARCVMEAIRRVKAGETDSPAGLLAEAGEHLAMRGAQALIAACTEIPVVLRQEHVRLPLIDATDALARLAVATARHLDASASAGTPEWDTTPVTWIVSQSSPNPQIGS